MLLLIKEIQINPPRPTKLSLINRQANFNFREQRVTALMVGIFSGLAVLITSVLQVIVIQFVKCSQCYFQKAIFGFLCVFSGQCNSKSIY